MVQLPHGVAARSGKIHRRPFGAYASLHVYENIVAAGLARQCQQAQPCHRRGYKPINITVYTEGTGVTLT
jgi:S-adenosylmethionine synthetase